MNRSNTPRDIKIEEEEGSVRLYKVWTKKKRSRQPFFITDSLDDFVDTYYLYCKQWNIAPNMERIYKLIGKHQQKQKQNE